MLYTAAVVTINHMLSEARNLIDNFDENALLDYDDNTTNNHSNMKTFLFSATDINGETSINKRTQKEMFVELMMMGAPATRPNGKTAYMQVEKMDVGQTITPKIMRDNEVLWLLEITRLT